MNTPTKLCARCKEAKPLTDFHKNMTEPDGHARYCKTCKSIRARDNYKRNRDSILEYQREYRTANPEKVSAAKKNSRLKKIDDYKARGRQHYRDNHERILAYNRQYRNTNKEQINTRRKNNKSRSKEVKNAWSRRNYQRNRAVYKTRNSKWLAEHPLKKRTYAHNRRAREIAAEGFHTDADIQDRYDKQKGYCYWCGEKVGKKYHVDHVIPLNKGGSNWPDNLVISCSRCNESKGDKMPHEWEGNHGKMF